MEKKGMGLPQPKTLHGPEIRERISSYPPSEPARPIESVQGEVAAMHSMIASRLAQRETIEGNRPDARDVLEIVITKLSRLSGYAAMGIALVGIAFLIF